MIQEKFEIQKDIIQQELTSILDILEDTTSLTFYLEYPYIDKFYRDSYYSFFAKKHHNYNRNSFRISIFKEDLKAKSIHDIENLDAIYLGYFTLRPTPLRIIGSTVLSPKALKIKSIQCCQCRRTVLVHGHKISIEGFPYSGQDAESITCAETSIINIMDYFGHKYPEYSTILPSQINKILSKQSSERQLPSMGLYTEQMSFVLKKLGFGVKVYTKLESDNEASTSAQEIINNNRKEYGEKEFKKILYTYVESGIPIIANLEDHSILIIGHEKYNGRKDLTSLKLVVMNDNHPPYELVTFEDPLNIGPANKKASKKPQIISFIVPLYNKVFLEANNLIGKFDEILTRLENLTEKEKELKQEKEGEKSDPPPIKFADRNKSTYRFYLTTSRSYKDYIGRCKEISSEIKELIIGKTMPKFIWVCEIIEAKYIAEKQTVGYIVLLDATETVASRNILICAKTPEIFMYKKNNEGISPKKYEIITTDTEKFPIFANNLK